MQFSLCDGNGKNCKNATALKEYLAKRNLIMTVAMVSSKFYP
jgi:hypothetical protein